MHFKTLVTVYMPTVEEDPHENAAVRQSIELLQAQKDELAKNLMAEITLCSLMGRTTNFARQLVSAVEEVMTPYSTEPPEEYMEFADMTEELKADYAKSVDCLKLPNGKIVECGSYPYFSKYSIVDGKVSQNKVGPLHHTRRTKQSRKIQYLPNCPRQKVYKTFEKYAEDYRGYEYNKEEKRYGFYCNPNAMGQLQQKIPCTRRIYVGFGSKEKRHLLGYYAELVYCSGYGAIHQTQGSVPMWQITR